MHRLALLPLLAVAGVAAAQTSGIGGTTGSLPGSAQSVTGSLSGGALLGRPPAPLGTTRTLGERIDRAAGLGPNRGLGLSGSAGTGARLPATGIGGLSASDSVLNNAGRPAGTPFGTDATRSSDTALPN